ncbi:MAG: cytochrome c biogenesis protein ResB [Desulfobacterales bacterium]|nr:cytochrome c biogenesis protein ResB [Desulfobacterales bacterium]
MSVRLTVFLLLSLAGVSIIGTLIPQNKGEVAYAREYGEAVYNIFKILDVTDMYHAWWFQVLLLLLAVNLIACSLDRIPAALKIVFLKNPLLNISSFRRISNGESFTDNRTPGELKGIYEPVISKVFGSTRVEETDEGFRVFAEKWRWTRLGVYIVHLSVLLLLLGGIIGSMFGFEGFVNIAEGESVDKFRIRGTGEIKKLDFRILCEDFDVSFYNNGAPKEFRSSLAVIDDDKTVLKKNIIVNDPLTYKGITFFQASYGELPPEKPKESGHSLDDIVLNFQSKETGRVYKIKAEIGKTVEVPEGGGQFMIMEYKDAADFMGQNIGDALLGVLTPKEGSPVKVMLPLHFPNFDKMRKGAMLISVANQEKKTFTPEKKPEKRYYTGLQVTRDPGVWVVYSGFIVMILGCIITFFMSHQKLYIDVTGSGGKSGKSGKSEVTVAGSANKNKLGMQMKVKRICRDLAGKDSDL